MRGLRRPADYKMSRYVVILSCQHARYVEVEHGWTPHSGHTYRPDEQNQAALARWRRLAPDALDLGEVMVQFFTRSLEDGRPNPPLEYSCFACAAQQPIVAYDYLGPLKPGASQPRKQPQASAKSALERKLVRLEHEADQLRRKLNDFHRTDQ